MTQILNPYVIIATKGRPEDVPVIKEYLLAQTMPPKNIIFVGTEAKDFGEAVEQNNEAHVEFIYSERPGLTTQRNVGIERVLEIHGTDNNFIIAYFDDDYRPAKDWLEIATKQFASVKISGLTGAVLADGITGPGVTEEQAQNYLNGETPRDQSHWTYRFQGKKIKGAYGCNMAFSAEVSREIRFDETLPAYGWLEDRDYSVKAMKYGPVHLVNECKGVHLGTKKGRQPGQKFGYSQVSNPLYLLKNGTMQRKDTYKTIGRNFLANHGKMFKPEPWIDRKGRAAGNWKALFDLFRGRLSPQRINDL